MFRLRILNRYCILGALLCVVFVLCLSTSAIAQPSTSPGTDVFLQGRYLEVGVSADGAFGSAGDSTSLTTSSPYGAYHPRPDANSTGIGGGEIGFRADRDLDGWTTGAPAPDGSDGDYFFPGSPEEGFCVAIDTSTTGIGVSNYCNNRASGTNGVPFSGSGEGLTNYQNTAGVASVSWRGTVAGLQVDQTYSVAELDTFMTVVVTLTNTSALTMGDVYYMRNVDPDNNVSLNGSFVTTNRIHKQFPTDNAAVVYATQSDGSFVELSSFDSNTRVTHGGFANRNAYNVWNGIGLNTSGIVTADEAISLAYKVSNFTPGATATFTFEYRFAPSTALVSLTQDIDIDEGGVKTATVTASLFRPISQDVVINLQYGGTASPSDYTGTPTTGVSGDSATRITIPAASTTGSVEIVGVPDALAEGDETVEVSIASAVNADIAVQSVDFVIF